MARIYYRDGYKYQLAVDYSTRVRVFPARSVIEPFIHFYPNGGITIKAGYAWDGPSGPAIDTPSFMRGSLIHDALYQLMRDGHLDVAKRKKADEELRRICLEDGMSAVRAWWVYQGVRFGGGPAADPRYDNPVLGAP